MSYDQFEDNSKIFKALSDINRLKIVQLLSTEEKCGCEILKEFNFTQPTLSHHMKVLTDCNLVTARKAGTWSYYKINNEKAFELLKFLEQTLCL